MRYLALLLIVVAAGVYYIYGRDQEVRRSDGMSYPHVTRGRRSSKMRPRLSFAFTFLFVSANCVSDTLERDQSSLETFMKALSSTAGPGARPCGSVALGVNSDEAFKCAREAIEAGAAFWVAKQFQGVDSQLWAGAVGDPKGVLYQVNFDSDETGGSAPRPKSTFKFNHCKTLEFDDAKGKIVCKPSRH